MEAPAILPVLQAIRIVTLARQVLNLQAVAADTVSRPFPKPVPAERLPAHVTNVQNVTQVIIFLHRIAVNLLGGMNAAVNIRKSVTPKPIFPAEHASMIAANIIAACPAAVLAIPAVSILTHRNVNAIPDVTKNCL